MDNRAQVREFLASRRARITPGQAGLPAYGGNRRAVPSPPPPAEPVKVQQRVSQRGQIVVAT
jgi:hypothetical protein